MERTMFIENTAGLHAKLAVRMIQVASKYPDKMTLYYNDKKVDLKSILGLMSLAVECGKEVTIEIEGPNAEQALEELREVLQ
jgi:phosphocarrier protein HPr